MRPLRHTGAALLLLWLAPPASPPLKAAGCEPTLRLPQRAASAPAGSVFMRSIAGLPAGERQRRIAEQLLAGNVPARLRQLWPLQLEARSATGEPLELVVWVLPDYLALGSDQDFVRVSLDLPTALRVARRLGATLPTPELVDQIHARATRQLSPLPLPPGSGMRSVAYLLRHEQLIRQQCSGQAGPELLAGHKKDLVLTRRLAARPGRVAIYGWHRPDGSPIQPLSTVHGAGYADYSHGVRLVADTVLMAGEPRSIYELLEDPALAPLVSGEGVLELGRGLFEPQPGG